MSKPPEPKILSLREALLRGLMRTEADDEEYRIILVFETMEDMKEARWSIYHAMLEKNK